MVLLTFFVFIIMIVQLIWPVIIILGYYYKDNFIDMWDKIKESFDKILFSITNKISGLQENVPTIDVAKKVEQPKGLENTKLSFDNYR